MMEDVKTRQGEPVLVESDGRWIPGYVEFGDENSGMSIACEPGGGRIVLFSRKECQERVRPDPGGPRPLRDSRGIQWPR